MPDQKKVDRKAENRVNHTTETKARLEKIKVRMTDRRPNETTGAKNVQLEKNINRKAENRLEKKKSNND